MESSSLIWPNSGMTLAGVAYELPTWVLHISGLGSSSLPGGELLPTPVHSDGKGTFDGYTRAGGASLRELKYMLPTPAAEEARGTPEQHLARKKKGDGYERMTVTSLGILVKTLPTPTASDAHSAGSRNLPGSKAKPGVSLTDIFRTGDSTTSRLLPTPTTQDAHNNSGPSQQDRNTEPLNVVAAKLLPSPTTHASERGKGDAERYMGPKSQNSRRSNLEDAIEAVKEGSPWIGESSVPQSSAGSASPDPLQGQLTIEDVSTPASPSGCSDTPRDGATSPR